MAANSFGLTGFTPVRHLSGGLIRVNAFPIATSGGTGFDDSIFSGDAVALNGDGTIELFAVGAGSEAAPTLLGVFAGCSFTQSSDNTYKFAPNWVASTAVVTGTTITAWVYDDPMTVFAVTTDATTAMTQTLTGLNADHVQGTGSTFTGQSGASLNVTTGIQTATAAFRILRIIDMPGNTVGNTKCRVEVICNEHVYRLGIGT
jgi:hypothetical protein